MKEPFDMLSQIQQVDAPPFLWTRIQQKIKEDRENKLSPAFAYLLGLSFVLLISLNVWVIAQKKHTCYFGKQAYCANHEFITE